MITLLTITGSFGELLTSDSEGCLKYISLNNGPFHVIPTLFNINFDQPLYCSFTVSVNKHGGRGNTIDYLYA